MMLKQTKIVASISDQRCEVEFIRDLFKAGMNVVRMNTVSYTHLEQKVYFNDIDGEENGGAFKSDSVLIKDMNQKKLEEGGHCLLYTARFV